MLQSTSRVCVGLGSNLGKSKEILLKAWNRLGSHRSVSTITISSPYESEPLDMESEQLFINAVGLLETDLPPTKLLSLFKQVEEEFGRARKKDDEGYQDRLLDLDILYYGELILSSSTLTLPHPHMRSRLFVLAPLTEIVPDLIDCSTGRTVSEIQSLLINQMHAGRLSSQKITKKSWD